jgi:Spy/CpxP family protein refolding chaperone
MDVSKVILVLALFGTIYQPGLATLPQQVGRPAAPTGGKPSPTPKVDTPRERPSVPWWSDPAIIKEIGLSSEQSARIQKLVDQRAKEASPFHEALERQQASLERISRDRSASESAFRVQLSVVISLQAEVSQGRAIMLFRMSRILTVDQNRKLEEIRNRQSSGRRAGLHHQ